MHTYRNSSRRRTHTSSRQLRNTVKILKENMVLIMSGSSSVDRQSYRSVSVCARPSWEDVTGSVRISVVDDISFHRVLSQDCTLKKMTLKSVQKLKSGSRNPR